MVAKDSTLKAVEGDHIRWRDEHLSWAGDVQVWESTIDAALFDVELALWGTQYTELDVGFPVDAIERMYTVLNDLSAALRKHGNEIRQHEAALVQHQRRVEASAMHEPRSSDGCGHQIMTAVHEEQRAFRKRFRNCFDTTMGEMRNLLGTESSVH